MDGNRTSLQDHEHRGSVWLVACAVRNRLTNERGGWNGSVASRPRSSARHLISALEQPLLHQPDVSWWGLVRIVHIIADDVAAGRRIEGVLEIVVRPDEEPLDPRTL